MTLIHLPEPSAEPSAEPPSPSRLTVEAPFHLEATVRLLARRPTNRVDLWEQDRYLRVLELDGELHLVSVHDAGTVDAPDLRVMWPSGRPSPTQQRRLGATLRRTLGLDQPTAAIERLALKDPCLRPLARKLRGMRPPRFPTLFEAVANVIPFQQVSLDAGAAIVARLVERFGRRLVLAGRTWFAFPAAAAIGRAPVAALQSIGLSRTKALSLQELARQVVCGELTEERLAALGTDEAMRTLMELPGIGPWSAGVLLLRGLGRMDSFPSGDVGVARGLARLLGLPADRRFAYEDYVRRFGDCRGYFYFYNLGAQLLERGLIHPASSKSSARALSTASRETGS